TPRRPKKPTRSASGLWTGLQFRPELHPLEDRTVPDVKLSNGILTITGTAAAGTAIVSQTAGSGNQPDRVKVTLNGQVYDFKVTQVNQIQANLLDGNDTITLNESDRRVTPPSSFNSDGGSDSLIILGTAGADAITVTSTTVGLTGAGLLTY